MTDGRTTEVLSGDLAVGDELIVEAVAAGLPRPVVAPGMGGGPPQRGMRSMF